MVKTNRSELQRTAAGVGGPQRDAAGAGGSQRAPAGSSGAQRAAADPDQASPGQVSQDWPLVGLEHARPLVMGIVNVTDDSFSGDGLRRDSQAAIAQARAQVAAGADLIDLGAESTRPGAAPVGTDEEIARLLPVLAGLQDLRSASGPVPISVDTRHAATMRAVLAAGATIINDISALEDDPESLSVVAGANCPVVLMHKQGDPQTMQQAPHYDDVVAEVHDYLEARIAACISAGIPRGRIIVDPGIGFGKTLAHNLALLRGLNVLQGLGCAILVGVSRKAMIGALTGEAVPARRVAGSIAAALWAAHEGAQILRVHDVAETVQALKVYDAITAGGPPGLRPGL